MKSKRSATKSLKTQQKILVRVSLDLGEFRRFVKTSDPPIPSWHSSHSISNACKTIPKNYKLNK